MGPNALWLAESLSEVLPLSAGMRVLDLGCGKALSSIFLAREFGARVWAADLWIPPSENWERIRAAGAEHDVVPMRVEAHDLPFAAGFFDAIVSFDAYHYFGTDDLFLAYLAGFLRPEGRIGIVSPGLTRELEDEPPDHLRPWWEPDFYTFHSAEWWRRLWSRSGRVAVEVADTVPDGWKQWLQWTELCIKAKAAPMPDYLAWAVSEAEMLRADDGRTFTLVRVVAREDARPGSSSGAHGTTGDPS
jgi:cyclopropane fatty-acyl-phospholipid synthase-like methyltransferase